MKKLDKFDHLDVACKACTTKGFIMILIGSIVSILGFKHVFYTQGCKDLINQVYEDSQN